MHLTQLIFNYGMPWGEGGRGADTICLQCRWQVTTKHAYTLDPMKSELSDHAVQAQCGNLSGKLAHMQLVREHLATALWTETGLKSAVGVCELFST